MSLKCFMFGISFCFWVSIFCMQNVHFEQDLEKNGSPCDSLAIEKATTKKEKNVPKIVLTGAPGSGKTSILLGLQMRGEHIIREAATDYIMYNQAIGIACPWEKKGYCSEIIELEIMLESRISPDATRVFIDRGFHDSLAYIDPKSDEYKKILEIANENKYDLVFFIEQLDFCEQTDVRREDKDAAKILGEKVRKIYQDAGYELITIKKGALNDRVDQILDEVSGRNIGKRILDKN